MSRNPSYQNITISRAPRPYYLYHSPWCRTDKVYPPTHPGNTAASSSGSSKVQLEMWRIYILLNQLLSATAALRFGLRHKAALGITQDLSLSEPLVAVQEVRSTKLPPTNALDQTLQSLSLDYGVTRFGKPPYNNKTYWTGTPHEWGGEKKHQRMSWQQWSVRARSAERKTRPIHFFSQLDWKDIAFGAVQSCTTAKLIGEVGEFYVHGLNRTSWFYDGQRCEDCYHVKS